MLKLSLFALILAVTQLGTPNNWVVDNQKADKPCCSENTGCQIYTDYQSIDKSNPGKWNMIYPCWKGDCSDLKTWYLVKESPLPKHEIKVKENSSGNVQARPVYPVSDLPCGTWRWKAISSKNKVFYSNTFTITES